MQLCGTSHLSNSPTIAKCARNPKSFRMDEMNYAFSFIGPIFKLTKTKYMVVIWFSALNPLEDYCGGMAACLNVLTVCP